MIADKIYDQRIFNEKIAHHLCQYWAERGYSVAVKIDRVIVGGDVVTDGNNSIYAIRSDMRDGWPAGKSAT